MRLTLGLIIILVVIYISIKHWKVLLNIKSIRIFQNVIKSRPEKRFLIEKLHDNYYNELLLSPELNIKINSSGNYDELIEKTNLHRARLAKFGQSKMNGVTFFKGPKGGIYIYTKNGKKRYL